MVSVEQQQQQVFRELKQSRELSEQLVRRVQELGENRRRLSARISAVTAARREPVAKGAPVLGYQHLQLDCTIDKDKNKYLKLELLAIFPNS